MGIHGTVVLEYQVVQFEIDAETLMGSYTVTDLITGRSFGRKTLLAGTCATLIALAVAWEGEPLTAEDVSRLEALQSPDAYLRVIP
jgi:hypothetical protein